MDIKTNHAALRIVMNRISAVYTDIPKIVPAEADGGISEKDALKRFGEIFSVTDMDDRFYDKIMSVYSALKKLCRTELHPDVSREISMQHESDLKFGDRGERVTALQRMLSAVLLFHGTDIFTEITGDFDSDTEAAVCAFAKLYGLPPTGIADKKLTDYLVRCYLGIAAVIPPFCREILYVPFNGQILREGMSGDDVEQLQKMLNRLHEEFPEIPKLTETGRFGSLTAKAVKEAQRLLGIPATGAAGSNTRNGIAEICSDLYAGSQTANGQFPGYVMKQ